MLEMGDAQILNISSGGTIAGTDGASVVVSANSFVD